MQAIISALEADGCPIMTLEATLVGVPLYRSFGFMPEGTVTRWTRTAAPPITTPPDSASVSIASAPDLDEISAFDAPYFGASRAAVISCLAAQHGARCLYSRRPDGSIGGYLIVTATGDLAPFCAADVQIAEVLLQAALRLPDQPESFMINIPDANVAAALMLEQYGFTPGRGLQHMRCGRQHDPR